MNRQIVRLIAYIIMLAAVFILMFSLKGCVMEVDPNCRNAPPASYAYPSFHEVWYVNGTRYEGFYWDWVRTYSCSPWQGYYEIWRDDGYECAWLRIETGCYWP